MKGYVVAVDVENTSGMDRDVSGGRDGAKNANLKLAGVDDRVADVGVHRVEGQHARAGLGQAAGASAASGN